MRRQLALGILTILLIAGQCLAQQTTSSGMFGSRTMGSSLSAGKSSFSGASSQLGSMGSQSGLGTSGFGATTGSQMGFNQNATTGVGGQARRAGDFVGATTQQLTGQGFVGAAQAAGNTGMGQTGAQGQYGRIGSMNTLGAGQFGTQQAAGQFGAQQGRTAASNIRVSLRLGFDAPTKDASLVSSRLATRLTGLPALHWLTPCQVEIRGRTAFLRGSVATQHDRDLAERVVLLEAAIDRVENQIVVSDTGKKPPERPTKPLPAP